jgi:multidrug/hemolysin transport system ATP-binding protein
LDEPTTGLDPQGRNVVWQTIAKLQREFGLTVFLTTHYLEETERAEQVYLIDHGRILTHGTPASLRAQYAPDTLRLMPFAADGAQVTSWLTEHNYPWSRKDDVLLVDVAPPEALKILDLCRPHLRDFEYLHGTMEEVFLKLTGENLRETGGNND